jgi:hypothetical protein
VKTSGEKQKSAVDAALCLVVELEKTSVRGLPAFSFEEKAAESLRSSSRCHNQDAFLALVECRDGNSSFCLLKLRPRRS